VVAGDGRKERRTRTGVVGKAHPEAKATRVRGSSRTFFPVITAWPGTGVISRLRPIPHAGRYLLRFWQVDYLADVWLNGSTWASTKGPESRSCST